jgi:hypothetical protein
LIYSMLLFIEDMADQFLRRMRRSRMIQRLRFCGGLSGSSRLYKIKSSTPRRYVRIGNNARRQCLLFFEISLRRNRVWCSLSRTLLHLTPVLESAPASTPRAVCREAAVSIMQKLPPSLVDHTTLSKAGIFTCPDSLRIHSAGYYADVLSPV